MTRFVEEHLPRLKQLYQPQAVILFGSRARGGALAESDLDLVIVSNRFRDVPFLDRAARLLTDLDVPFAIDVL